MITLYLPLIVALVGGVVYLTVAQPKWAELGRLAFWVGLLAYLIKFTA